MAYRFLLAFLFGLNAYAAMPSALPSAAWRSPVQSMPAKGVVVLQRGRAGQKTATLEWQSDCRDGAMLASKNSKQSCQEHETGDEASFLWLWQLGARRALQEAGKRNSSVAL